MKKQDSIAWSKKPNTWNIGIPLKGIRLTEATNKELKIRNYTIYDSKKFWRKRKQNGFLNEDILKKDKFKDQKLKVFNETKELFLSADSILVTQKKGKKEEISSEITLGANEIINFIASSQIVFCPITRFADIEIISSAKQGSRELLFVSPDGFAFNSHQTGFLGFFLLDSRWKTFVRKTFFWKFIKLVNQKHKGEKADWVETLFQAAVLVGQSTRTNDLHQALLLKVTALEMLLLIKSDRKDEKLFERLFALMGWVDTWPKHSKEINRLYEVRSNFVHKGVRDGNFFDLLILDLFLFNSLRNFVNLIDVFSSKKEFIKFSDIAWAKKFIGLGKTKIWKGNFTFTEASLELNEFQIKRLRQVFY